MKEPISFVLPKDKSFGIRNDFIELKDREEKLKERLYSWDIRTLFEQKEEKDDCKPKRTSNFWNNNYIEYESDGNKNRNLSLDDLSQ